MVSQNSNCGLEYDHSPPPVVAVPVWTAPEDVPDREAVPVCAALGLPLPLEDTTSPEALVGTTAPPVLPGRASVVAVTVAADDLHAFWQFSKAKFSAAVPFP
jgi:hypothetical protein